MRFKKTRRCILGIAITGWISCRQTTLAVQDPLLHSKEHAQHAQGDERKLPAIASKPVSIQMPSENLIQSTKKGPLACSEVSAEASTRDLSWIPRDTRAFVLAQTGHPHWEQSIKSFEFWLRNSENQKRLPLRVKFELSLLRTESQLIHRLLEPLATTSSLLFKIMPPNGQGFWMWRHLCDLNRLANAMRHQWNLEFRQDLNARIGVGSPKELLPFDVLLLSGGRGIFAAPDSHSSVLSWLEGPSSASLGIKTEMDVEASLAGIQNTLGQAQLVVVTPSIGFLGTSETRQSTQAPLLIVVRDQRIWINGIQDQTTINP